MADFRLGRLKFNWKGNWAVSTAFVIDDIVKYGGNTYVCTTNHTSAANENLFYSSDVSKWSLHTEGVVNKGDWAATTWYKINDVVKYGNTQYRVTTGFTTSGVFDNTYLTIYLEGLKFESTWSSGTTYQVGDIVTYGGYSYTAYQNHSSSTTPNADNTNWKVLTTGFIAKGEYASGTAYVPGDVVRFGGYSYVNKLTSTGNAPTSATYWDLITEGFNWLGAWNSATVYQLGDVVNRNSNSYVCKASDTTGASTAPELDPGGAYWNYIAQGGSAAQVLQSTGDLLYQAASGINRISLPTGSTGSAAQQREASGQVLTVGGSPLLPNWETNNTTTSVYYVAETGSDSNSGRQISRAFLTIRHAMAFISTLDGSDKPSATNPVSVYVKAGIYEETLPIHVPEYVSILGDNIRNTIVKPATGNSNEQDITLASALTHYKLGETISNDAGTKTGKLLDINAAKTVVTILNASGGSWTTSDKYVDIVSTRHADGSDLLTQNSIFIAHEAYHRHVANVGAVSGTEASVKSRLDAAVTAIAYNVKHGGTNKVYDYANALIGGTAITGNNTQDTQLLNYINTVGLEVLQSITVTKSAGNNQTQVMFGGTADSNPKCANVQSAHTSLVGIVTTAISNNNMSGATNTNGYVDISSAATIINSESTMFYLATHNIVKDLVMENMTGFVPYGADDKDITQATVKGVYFRLDPASPVTRSPYIQNCSAIGGAAVGVVLDGKAHAHFDNSATPSFKSMCFDAYTQVLEDGVGFWCDGTSAAEVVSSFTYYSHISYTSTGGARIRAVSGNSSYGKYGCISRGFDVNETTTDGTIAGKMLTTDSQGASSGTFTVGEIITGAGGAIGELISDQSVTANKIYYIPRKGTFAQGELITGATSTATATLVNNTDAVRGQLGFLLVAAGLTTGPDQGGSVSMVDDGQNNDAGSYVISNSSYTAPDGRGALTVTRAQLGSSAAAHDGHSNIEFYEAQGNTATLQTNIASGASSPFTMNVDAVTGMTINGFLVINNELFKVTSFPSATSVTAARAQEGTSAGTHNSGATIKILNAKVASQDKTIEDVNSGATSIRVEKSNVGFGASDVIKINNEFMHVSSVSTDTTGTTILQFADEKTIGCTDGQSFKIRYRYSQVRLTAHDFLDVGTGNRTTTNWPYLSTQANVPSQETDETRPGRVYYVSTDQDGNFSVGKFFRVEQATGKATLDASAFDLSGLSSLRLGSIGAQLGASINEFSTDGTLTQNSDVKVPTQKAVKTYIDSLSAVSGNFNIGGNLTVKGSTTTVASVDVETKDRNLTLAKVAAGSFTGDITNGSNQITNISDTVNIAPGVVITLSSGGGSVTLSGTVKVTALSGTTATLDATFGGTGAATGATFGAGGPTDVTADGGGLTIKGSTDKTIAFSDAQDRFDISEHINIPVGKSFYINGVEVLSSTQVLGTSIGSGGGIVTESSTSTLTNKTISSGVLTGSLTAGGGTGSSGQYLQSTASGVQWATLTVDATKIENGNSKVDIASSNSNVVINTGSSGTLCATFNTSQNLIVAGTVTAQSSIVLKDNVETIPNALARVLNLRGVEWDYKSNGTHNLGVVAEEIEKEFPCLVHKGDNGIKSVAYQNIVGVLIEAIKDLKSEIDQLKGV